MIKRLFDIGVSCAVLIVLAPLFVLIALAIVLDSGTPVFYRQVRVGRGRVPFRILKFRSMRPDADRHGRLTVSNDLRVTRVGSFLRRYKLDELPQFANVLMGQMSLVGPRPEVPEFVDEYSPEDAALVLSVRPGITDNASIEFRNENDLLDAAVDPKETYIATILPTKLAYYRDYVRQRSFLGDLKILWRTFGAIVGR